jgi:hypothetical protein
MAPPAQVVLDAEFGDYTLAAETDATSSLAVPPGTQEVAVQTESTAPEVAPSPKLYAAR